jgi:hypothetical protein
MLSGLTCTRLASPHGVLVFLTENPVEFLFVVRQAGSAHAHRRGSLLSCCSKKTLF